MESRSDSADSLVGFQKAEDADQRRSGLTPSRSGGTNTVGVGDPGSMRDHGERTFETAFPTSLLERLAVGDHASRRVEEAAQHGNAVVVGPTSSARTRARNARASGPPSYSASPQIGVPVVPLDGHIGSRW